MRIRWIGFRHPATGVGPGDFVEAESGKIDEVLSLARVIFPSTVAAAYELVDVLVDGASLLAGISVVAESSSEVGGAVVYRFYGRESGKETVLDFAMPRKTVVLKARRVANSKAEMFRASMMARSR